jgi:hypothetical protein
VAFVTPAPSATFAPTAIPTGVPTVAPTATTTTAPTASPTPVPLALKVIGGAPISATASQLSNARRTAQAKTQAQGVTNGLPILVESSGMVAAYGGTQVTWVTNAQTSTDVAESSATITPSGALPINNPGITPLNCVGSLTAVCVVHPLGWNWGTSSINGKPVGKQTLSVSFSDGTSGSTFDYIYDGWNLPCNSGWAYVSGVPVAQATKATSDVYADCVNGNIDFPLGAYVLSQPSADQYGRYETQMPNFTAQPIFSAANAVVSMKSISPGIIFAINTQDGGFAKVYFGTSASSTTTNAASGMALHSSGTGAFDF